MLKDQSKFIKSDVIIGCEQHHKGLLYLYENITNKISVDGTDINRKYAGNPVDGTKLLSMTIDAIKRIVKPSKIGEANKLIAEYCNTFPDKAYELKPYLIELPEYTKTEFVPDINMEIVRAINRIHPTLCGYFMENLLDVAMEWVDNFIISGSDTYIRSFNSYFKSTFMDLDYEYSRELFTKFKISMFKSQFAFALCKSVIDMCRDNFDYKIVNAGIDIYAYILNHYSLMKQFKQSIMQSKFLHSISDLTNECGVKVEHGIIDIKNEEYIIDVKCYTNFNNFTPYSWYGQLYTYNKRLNSNSKLVVISIGDNTLYEFKNQEEDKVEVDNSIPSEINPELEEFIFELLDDSQASLIFKPVVRYFQSVTPPVDPTKRMHLLNLLELRYPDNSAVDYNTPNKVVNKYQSTQSLRKLMRKYLERCPDVRKSLKESLNKYTPLKVKKQAHKIQHPGPYPKPAPKSTPGPDSKIAPLYVSLVE